MKCEKEGKAKKGNQENRITADDLSLSRPFFFLCQLSRVFAYVFNNLSEEKERKLNRERERERRKLYFSVFSLVLSLCDTSSHNWCVCFFLIFLVLLLLFISVFCRNHFFYWICRKISTVNITWFLMYNIYIFFYKYISHISYITIVLTAFTSWFIPRTLGRRTKRTRALIEVVWVYEYWTLIKHAKSVYCRIYKQVEKFAFGYWWFLGSYRNLIFIFTCHLDLFFLHDRYVILNFLFFHFI